MLKEFTNNEWFKNWFDTPFYHHLYDERNFEEATCFIDQLLKNQIIKADHSVLDLCCGKGRHSIYLNAQGINTVGVDLSEQSIAYAKTFENNTLSFKIGDMRSPHTKEAYDVILNLFTSFGYFENDDESLQVLQACYQMLKPEGFVVLDFLNSNKIRQNFSNKNVHQLTIDKSLYRFEIQKKMDDRFVHKEIKVFSKSSNSILGLYQERVRLFTKDDFLQMFENSGFSILSLYGGYDLQEFNKNESERLIIHAKKLK